jgi:hypothetical protein
MCDGSFRDPTLVGQMDHLTAHVICSFIPGGGGLIILKLSVMYSPLEFSSLVSGIIQSKSRIRNYYY